MRLEYLIVFLFQVGPTMAGGMGPAPLTHVELRAWQTNMGLQLQPWEANALRDLSIEWIAQLRAAESPDCKPPYGGLRRANPAELDRLLDEALK